MVKYHCQTRVASLNRLNVNSMWVEWRSKSVSMSQISCKYLFFYRASVAKYVGNLIWTYKLNFHVTNRNKKFNRNSVAEAGKNPWEIKLQKPSKTEISTTFPYDCVYPHLGSQIYSEHWNMKILRNFPYSGNHQENFSQVFFSIIEFSLWKHSFNRKFSILSSFVKFFQPCKKISRPKKKEESFSMTRKSMGKLRENFYSRCFLKWVKQFSSLSLKTK